METTQFCVKLAQELGNAISPLHPRWKCKAGQPILSDCTGVVDDGEERLRARAVAPDDGHRQEGIGGESSSLKQPRGLGPRAASASPH
jgi:hypothetical protein